MAKAPHPSAYDKDLYRILQVSHKAENAVVHAAYRALMKAHAPRLDTDTDHHAHEFNEAYAIVGNDTERPKYDAYRASAGVKRIGPYKIVERIAEGGFGVTYKAEHQLVGELSCLKHCSEISPVAEEILRQETKAIWNLRHFGLPIMRDLLRLDDGSYALAMSWIEGPTLEQVIEKHGKLDAEHVAWITERLLDILTYLHFHGVLHGDIKPQNIIIQEDKHLAVLVDFGLSIVKPTSTSRSKGHTELFSPPEQISGKTLVPGSDFYSLAMTLLYALGGSHRAVERREVPADVPDAFCAFIKKMMVRNVLERPMHAEELSKSFQQVRIDSFGRARSGMKAFGS